MMKIQVTQKHIAAGEPKEPERCPVSLAIKEIRPYAHRVSVGYGGVRVENSDFNWEYASISDDVVALMVRFDNEDEVNPFEFDLDLERHSFL